MKITPLIALVTLLAALSSFASGQHKHTQIMEMLKDSVMMDLMMDHIASTNPMRTQMMDKMIYYAIGDTVKMTEKCNKMIDDKRMLSFLMNIIDKRKKSNKTK